MVVLEGTMGRTVLAIVGVLALVGSSALAHHGYADFYLDQSKSVEGDLESFRYTNPHIVLTIRTTDSTLYTAIWGPPYQVERAGVTKTTLKIGDHLIVTGAPPRNPTSRELMPVWEIQRPRDGWKWARRSPAQPPSLGNGR
jgi:hypothetical protein